MNTIDVQNLLNPFIQSIENNNCKSAIMYAFKSNHPTENTNTHISLEYEIFKTNSKKNDVKEALKNILQIFSKKYLSKDTTIFEQYNVNNHKKTIDYLKLDNLDFTDTTIKNGTEENIKPDIYKIEYFLNCLRNESVMTNDASDYKKFRHSLIKYITNAGDEIIIINKAAPIYKPKGWLFILDSSENENTTDLKPLTSNLFRLPLYPHIIIVNGYCFMIEDNVESIFGFEEYNKKICFESVNKITSDISLTDVSESHIETFSKKKRNYNLFSSFNNERFNKIKQKDPETISKLKDKFKLTVDSSNNIQITSEKDAEILILYLCDCIFQDLDNDSLYQSKRSKKLTVN